MLTQESLMLAGGRAQVLFRAGDGPPLLWLHGLTGVDETDPVLAALTERYSVIAPLAPGFEDLDELGDVRNIHDLALHYDDVLEALGIERVPVVGHSFGAMIAAELAAHYPKRVSQLVLLSPLGLWNDEYPVADLFGVPATEMPKLLYADEERAKAALAPDPRGEVEVLIKFVRGMTTVARFLWPIPDRGLARRLYRVTAPTLVVHGERDAFVPVQYAHDLASAVRQGEVEVIDGAGHMLTQEAPEAVLRAINSRLREREAVA
jgi:pimeloyl-ACP methyl ester carboxylesterase